MNTIHFKNNNGDLSFKADDIIAVFGGKADKFDPDFVTLERLAQMVRDGDTLDGEELSICFKRVSS